VQLNSPITLNYKYKILWHLQINRVVDDHISHADMSASDVANTWTLIASEGDMKVYKREVEDTGAVVQHPLKAVHTVKVLKTRLLTVNLLNRDHENYVCIEAILFDMMKNQYEENLIDADVFM